MEQYYISLLDKGTRKLSNRIPLSEIIYNQDEVVFEFDHEEMGILMLSYNDFLWCKDGYEVIIEK